MGLYLAIFDDGKEIEGVEVGQYADFDFLRTMVVDLLEQGFAGSRFPILVLHSDCDGEWTPEESARLRQELETVAARFHDFPPTPFNSGWKEAVAKEFGIRPRNLYECFFDVDGEPLLERLIDLTRLSQERT